MPVGYRSHCDTRFETLGVSEGIARHESAITPAPPAQAVAIQLRETIQCLVKCSELIVEFHFAEFMSQSCGELPSPVSHTAIIDAQHRYAVMSQNLIEEERGCSPTIVNLLCFRAAVWIHQERDFLIGRCSRRHYQLTMKNCPIIGGEVHELRSQDFIGCERTRSPERIACSRKGTQLHSRWGEQRGVCIDVVPALLREAGFVRPVFVGDSLLACSIQSYRKQVLLPIIALIRGVEDGATLLIYAVHAGDFVVAARQLMLKLGHRVQRIAFVEAV